MPPIGRSSSLPNYADVARRMGPDGTQLALVELLSQNNWMMDQLHWKEANSPSGEVVGIRTALPSVAARRFNEGVPKSKGRTDKIIEGCAMFAGMSKIDEALGRQTGDVAKFRATEDDGFVHSLNNRFERGVFYDSSKTTPENMMGLTPRLDSLSGNYNDQIVDSQIAASGDDQTSIWAMVTGPDTVYGITPKGMPGGIVHKDLGDVVTEDENGNEWPFLTTKFELNCGLVVKDARYIARLANIDTSAIVKTGKLLIEDMTELVFRLLDLKKGRPVIFANRMMCQYMFHQAQASASNSTFSIDVDIEKRQRLLTFMGIPIYQSDVILNSESIVT